MLQCLTILFTFAMVFSSVQAQGPSKIPIPSIAPTGGPQSLGDLLNLVSTFTGWMFAFTVIIAVGAIIYGAFQYLISRGSSEAAGTGTKTIVYALVGVAIAGLAWGLVNVVGSVIFGRGFLGCSSGSLQCSATNRCYSVSNIAQCTVECLSGTCNLVL